MSIQITINGTDRTSLIDWKSIAISRALTNQTDTLSFKVSRANSSGFKPTLLDVVKVYDDSSCIFGGQIVDTSEKVDGMVEYVEVTANDFSFDMNKTLAIQVYENMTVDDIIADLKTNCFPTYDITNVSCPIVIKYIAFNYEMGSKCLQQLAELVSYDWYVDEDKKIYFFSKGSTSAPYGLTDTNGKYIYKSLNIRKDIKNIRNSIIVRGGTYQGNLLTESLIADGTQITFLQTYQYANISVTVNGTPKTLGIDFIDDPTTVDVLYNFNEKAIKFRSDNKPTAGQTVAVSGNPYIPVVTKLTDSASISEYGEFQYKIVDKSIASKEGARDRARAEIRQWALEVNEGEFKTYEKDLETGMKINIQSDIRSINQDYIISRISSRMDSPDRFVNTCTLVSSKTYGMVEFLQSLLIQKDKEIKISSDEVLDSVIGLSDNFTITDEITSISKSSPPYLYGTALWGFSTWG